VALQRDILYNKSETKKNNVLLFLPVKDEGKCTHDTHNSSAQNYDNGVELKAYINK